MSQRPDLFEEMQAQTPKTSTVEDLLGNPFDLEEAPSPASPHNDLVDAEMMAKRAANNRLMIWLSRLTSRI